MIVGLDGGTWRVLVPFAKAGLLPNLQHIIEKGSSGSLISTIPPITSPAWISMVTGYNPGKLGIYGILKWDSRDAFLLKPVTSSAYRGRAIWDSLSEKGVKVAIFKMPFLYPAYKVNGCMVSGFGSLDKMNAYPTNLYKKLKGPSLLREESIFQQLFHKANDTASYIQLIKQLKEVVREESELVFQLSTSLHPDFLFYVISATDWLQHAFMDKIIEATQKIELNGSSALDSLERTLVDFYQFIDSIIGRGLEILNKTQDDYFFFLVSDHGFTIRPYTFNLVRWLVENGYMKLRKREFGHSRIITLFFSKILILFGRSAYSEVLAHFLRILPSSIMTRLISLTRAQLKLSMSSEVDFNRSKVFCVEGGAIYANSSINEASFLDELTEKLNKFLKIEYGFHSLKIRALRKKEIYWGEKIELAPDLIIEILDDDRIWEITHDPKEPRVFPSKFPGKHDYFGIFCAYGPQLKKGVRFDNFMIEDVAPTILHLFDLAIPLNMDGKVLTELFKEGSDMSQRPVKYIRDEREKIKRVVEKLRAFSQI